MRKLLVLLATFATLAMFSIPASAGQGDCSGPPPPFTGHTITCTQNFHGVAMDFGVVPCPPFFPDVIVDANTVVHGIINANGSWFTTTITGSFVTVPPIYTGHVTAWFGDENNPTIEVMHFTVNGRGTSTLTGVAPLDFHAEGQFTLHADGSMSGSHLTVTCS